MKNLSKVSQALCRGPRAEEASRGLDSTAWAINLECSVAADTQRIFYALTVPEYIEAWICVPGCDPQCRNVTCRVARGFEIEHHCALGKATKISGTYRTFLKRKLSFTWKPAWLPHESLVDIRLYGNFEKSTLRLRHFGLASEADFNWHLSLWSASVSRLCGLFGDSMLSGDRAGQG